MSYLASTLPDPDCVHHISLTKHEAAGKTLLQPDGCWDIVIIKRAEGIEVMRTGLTTKTVVAEFEKGEEILGISFKPSAFMPSMSSGHMRDKGILLPLFGSRRFWLDGETLEIPTAENVDSFVQRLATKGHIVHSDVVESILAGCPKAMCERTMQRAFLRTTGLTYKCFTQIQRAQKAMTLLQNGEPATTVAVQLGFTDQSHMINSLKRIMGQTPRDIAKPSALTAWKMSDFYKLLAVSDD